MEDSNRRVFVHQDFNLSVQPKSGSSLYPKVEIPKPTLEILPVKYFISDPFFSSSLKLIPDISYHYKVIFKALLQIFLFDKFQV